MHFMLKHAIKILKKQIGGITVSLIHYIFVFILKVINV